MKLLIIGTGGIGGYYGFKLLQSGNEVVFTARGAHFDALKKNGLHIEHNGVKHHAFINVQRHSQVTSTYSPDDFDLLIVTLKSNATNDFINEMGEWLGKSPTPVLSLQNGVDNELALSSHLGEKRVIGGLAVRIGSHVVEPGKIVSSGKAEIICGVWPRVSGQSDHRYGALTRFSLSLNSASIPHEISDDIHKELWRKLIINNGVNPLSALSGLDTFELTHRHEFSQIVLGMMLETQSAANADGVNLSQQDVLEMFDLIKSFDPIKTSMLIDKEKGRPLELESIVGVVIEKNERLEIDAPYNKLVYALLKLGQGNASKGQNLMPLPGQS